MSKKEHIWGAEWRNEKGLYHREDGPAIERIDGDELWYIDGKLHRDDGPAIKFSYYKAWYRNGHCHRLDGPAREWSQGADEWIVNSHHVSIY